MTARGRAFEPCGDGSGQVDLSIVLPVYNEAAALPELYRRLKDVLGTLQLTSEIVVVDDGSTDGSGEIIKRLAADDPCVHVVTLRRNFGQTPALAAGFDAAGGRLIIAMDADLQHDPAEIPKFLDKLGEGYDIVSGWRARRVDNFWLRRLPSRVANRLIRWVSGVQIHDFGTTFKAYRAEVIRQIRLYGELHRFIPALASSVGARVTELPINNVNRPYGKSKYGLGRTLRVLLDLITVKFLLSYLTRPLQFFGLLGLLCLGLGLGFGGYTVVDKIFFGQEIMTQHGPLSLCSVLLILVGLSFISMGLLGEVLSRLYFEASDRRIYSIREQWRGGAARTGDTSADNGQPAASTRL